MDPSALTFMHMCLAIAGAGVVMYGEQKLCAIGTNASKYASCASAKDKNGKPVRSAKACADAYPVPNKKMWTIIRWGGFGFIVGSFIILAFLSGGGFGGMLSGGGGYGGGGYGGGGYR